MPLEESRAAFGRRIIREKEKDVCSGQAEYCSPLLTWPQEDTYKRAGTHPETAQRVVRFATSLKKPEASGGLVQHPVPQLGNCRYQLLLLIHVNKAVFRQ